jgi:hypothetical protein
MARSFHHSPGQGRLSSASAVRSVDGRREPARRLSTLARQSSVRVGDGPQAGLPSFYLKQLKHLGFRSDIGLKRNGAILTLTALPI